MNNRALDVQQLLNQQAMQKQSETELVLAALSLPAGHSCLKGVNIHRQVVDYSL